MGNNCVSAKKTPKNPPPHYPPRPPRSNQYHRQEQNQNNIENTHQKTNANKQPVTNESAPTEPIISKKQKAPQSNISQQNRPNTPQNQTIQERRKKHQIYQQQAAAKRKQQDRLQQEKVKQSLIRQFSQYSQQKSDYRSLKRKKIQIGVD